MDKKKKNAILGLTVIFTIVIIAAARRVWYQADIKEKELYSFDYHYYDYSAYPEVMERSVYVASDFEGNANISFAEKQNDSSRIVSEDYFVDDKILDELKNIFVKYKLNELNDCEYDSSHNESVRETYSFNIEGEDWVYFSTDMKLPEYSRKACDKISKVLESYRGVGAKYPSLVLKERSEQELLAFASPAYSEETFIDINGYYKNTLVVSFVNSSDTDELCFNSSYRIYKLGDEETLADYGNYDGSFTVLPNSRYDHTIYLTNRLDVGDYRIEIGNYSCEFSLE